MNIFKINVSNKNIAKLITAFPFRRYYIHSLLGSGSAVWQKDDLGISFSMPTDRSRQTYTYHVCGKGTKHILASILGSCPQEAVLAIKWQCGIQRFIQFNWLGKFRSLIILFYCEWHVAFNWNEYMWDECA